MSRRFLASFVAAALFLGTVAVVPVEAASLPVRFVSLPSAYPGDYETATVQTKAGANCSIVVNYKSGPSRAQGLYSKTAASNGRVSWTWKVGTRTTPGSWPVTVTCRKGSASGSATRNFNVL